MQAFRAVAIAAGLLLFFQRASGSAQIDYRNLDDDRPVVTEDAYPLERYGLELLAPYRFEAERDGAQLHAVVPEVAYGFVRNAQVGVKLPLAVRNNGAKTEWGLAGLRVFGLYNLNTEGPWFPAVALRADASLPVGSLAGDGSRFALKAIATRSWGRTRAHLNLGRGFGPEDALSVAEPLNRWSTSLAVDWTFFRSSLLLIGEVAATQATDAAPTAVNAALGGRWQWMPTLVLDVGVARRLSAETGSDIAVTVGLSHAFAIPGLMPDGRRNH